MRRLLLIATLLTAGMAHAQDRLVFIIDTVITPSDGFPVWELGTAPYSPPPIAMLDSDHITTFDPTWNVAPNVLLHLARNAGGIRLPLDDDGGTLIIRWPSNLARDTVRIARYEVFDRCVRDTILNRIAYYTVVDTGLVPIKTKEKRSLGPKPKCRKKPERIPLIINGVPFDVPITLEQSVLDGTVTMYHGYRPRGCNSDAQAPKGKCVYFHGREDWIQWNYSGELLLK